MTNRRTFLTVLSAAGAVSRTEAAFSVLTLENDPAGKTLRAPDGSVVFTYLTQKPAGLPLAGNNACCFHPLNTLSGERVTDIAPPDHPDHRGVFFAWQSLDFHRPTGIVRGDFWGWGHFAPVEGRAIVNRSVQLDKTTATTAEVSIRNDWVINGETMMTESTTAHVSSAGNARVLDLHFRFESPGDVVINRVAFTGLCVRCRKDGTSSISNKTGLVDLPDSDPLKPEMNWPAADSYSYTVALKNGKTVTAAVIDHPLNPPSTWHEPRPVAFLDPCISALKEIRIEANKPFVLRYRVIAQDGEAFSSTLNALAADWRSSK